MTDTHHPFRIQFPATDRVITHPGPIDSAVLHAESIGAPWVITEGSLIVAHDDGEERFQEAAE